MPTTNINKKEQGIFYTKNAEYILDGMSIPDNVKLLDPFAGEWDLLNLYPNHEKRGLDINPQNPLTELNDSLLNPLENIQDYWIVTNPPFLARNKSSDKKYYEKWKTDDLYKCALLSIYGCKGGIIILPLNFFSSDDKELRFKFLSKYNIERVNVFEEQVFEDTSYTVCAIQFSLKMTPFFQYNFIENPTINFHFYPSKEKYTFTLNKVESYSIAPELLNPKKYNPLETNCIKSMFPDDNLPKITRAIGDEIPNTNLFLQAIDTGSSNGNIKLIIRKDPFFAKKNGRAFAKINSTHTLNADFQEKIVALFNQFLNYNRKKYRSLFLSSYRNSTKHVSRKQIGLEFSYSLIEHIIFLLKIYKFESLMQKYSIKD